MGVMGQAAAAGEGATQLRRQSRIELHPLSPDGLSPAVIQTYKIPLVFKMEFNVKATST